MTISPILCEWSYSSIKTFQFFYIHSLLSSVIFSSFLLLHPWNSFSFIFIKNSQPILSSTFFAYCILPNLEELLLPFRAAGKLILPFFLHRITVLPGLLCHWKRSMWHILRRILCLSRNVSCFLKSCSFFYVVVTEEREEKKIF